MDLRWISVCVILCSSLLSTGACFGSSPNVVLFFTDDMGWTDWEYDATLNPEGSVVFKTPNLLSLAQSGVVFEQAYSSSPVCSSTRASLITGKTTARTNFTYLAGGNGGSGNTSATLKSPLSTSATPLSETTLAESLGSSAGNYHTGFIGKWHAGAGPTSHGYDYNIAGGGAGCPCSPVSDGFFAGSDGGWSGMPGITSGYPADAYLTDVLGDFAEDYIEQRAATSTPFFLHFAPYQVHVPLDAPADVTSKYATRIATLQGQGVDLKGHENATYAAMVEEMDKALGRVLTRLDDPDGDGNNSDSIRDNTIIIFAADNGGLTVGELGDPVPTANGPLREGKGSVYEGGIRTPMITSWTGNANITQGTVSNSRVSSDDFLPTILELTGLDSNPSVPMNDNIDGVSFAAALEGGTVDRGYQYWHMPHRSNQDQRGAEQAITFEGGAYVSAIRDNQFKMVYQYETGTYELYDLSNDIGETMDLLGINDLKAFELSAALHSYFVEVSPSMPIVKATGLATDLPPVLWVGDQGDFNMSGIIDAADWTQLKNSFFDDLSSLTAADAYGLGDFNLDGHVDRFDFAGFKTAYELAHGSGSFEALLNQVPESESLVLLVMMSISLLACSPRGKRGVA